MTPATLRLLGNIVLGIAIALLLVTLMGMLGIITKLARSEELVLFCVALMLAARGLRRRAKRAAGQG